MSAIRVALVNDYDIVVQGLRAMLRRYEGRIEFVELSVDNHVDSYADIALYDSFASPRSSPQRSAAIADNSRVGKAVLYSWEIGQSEIAEALARGVAGYISKTTPTHQMVETIEAIHRGDEPVHNPPGRLQANYGDWPGREEGLTQREAEILALITQGFSNEEIARHANITINSVKTYIRSCYRRIGVSRRAQAVLWGVQHGFLPDRVEDEKVRES